MINFLAPVLIHMGLVMSLVSEGKFPLSQFLQVVPSLFLPAPTLLWCCFELESLY
jgi:hypothetical protein